MDKEEQMMNGSAEDFTGIEFYADTWYYMDASGAMVSNTKNP